MSLESNQSGVYQSLLKVSTVLISKVVVEIYYAKMFTLRKCLSKYVYFTVTPGFMFVLWFGWGESRS